MWAGPQAVPKRQARHSSSAVTDAALRTWCWCVACGSPQQQRERSQCGGGTAEQPRLAPALPTLLAGTQRPVFVRCFVIFAFRGW